MAKHGNNKCVAATTEVIDAHVSQEISNIKQSIVALDSKISSILSNLGSTSCNTVSPVIKGIDSLATSATVENKKNQIWLNHMPPPLDAIFPRL